MDYCDLFSGIGGISLALKGIVRTVLYCEWDKYCQQVLSARMKTGQLESAPIHSDIRNLHFGSGFTPMMIGGGFPCQDISLSGLQKGILDGDRSGLFYEILRIIDESPSIQYIFLENVANIVKCGMKEVVDELAIKRKWSLQWTMKSAGGSGAPHFRNRWFCIGVRPGAQPPQPLALDTPHQFSWKPENEPEARVSFKPVAKHDPSYDDAWIQRCQALGNSVVPCVVREAFLELWKTACNTQKIFDCLGSYATNVETLEYPYPEKGTIFNGKFLGLPPTATSKRTFIEITGPSGNKIGSFPTPRRGITHASMVTERSMHDLPTVLINSKEAIDYIKREIPANQEIPEKLMSIVIPNVNYIEWMMGYQKDWTRLPPTNHIQKPVKPVTTTTHHKSRRNGMHMFMHENPGKDVKTIAIMWRALEKETKAKYTALAKQISA